MSDLFESGMDFDAKIAAAKPMLQLMSEDQRDEVRASLTGGDTSAEDPFSELWQPTDPGDELPPQFRGYSREVPISRSVYIDTTSLKTPLISHQQLTPPLTLLFV